MTTLTELIDNFKSHLDDFPERSKTYSAAMDLGLWMLAHAAAFAERDRLEAAVVEAWKVERLCIERDQGTDTHLHMLDCEVERDELSFAQDMLTLWLVERAHAASDDPAARS